MFEGRLPARAAGPGAEGRRDRRGPRGLAVRRARSSSRSGSTRSSAARREDWKVEPTRFDEMRPGCYDIDARVRDMDINGVWASVNFPSQITGFCGSVFSRCSDPELGLAVTRAWNDWFFDEWYSPHPDRIVPMGITYLADAEQGAAEIRRNAARGFTAVTLPEMPHRIGMEPIFSAWWDPIIAACAETDTVICLHVGSTGVADMPTGAPMVPLGATLFGQLSLARVRGVAVVGLRGAAPRPEDHHERGRHRLGRDAARPAREHRRPLGLRPLLPRRPPPGRGAAPQLLVLHDRRSVDAVARARRSASTTSRSSPTTRTATAPGPTRRRCSPTCSARSPPTRSRRSATRTRPRCSAIRCRRRRARTRSASGRDVDDAADYATLLRNAYLDEVRRRRVLRRVGRRSSPTPNGARSSRRCRRSRRAPSRRWTGCSDRSDSRSTPNGARKQGRELAQTASCRGLGRADREPPRDAAARARRSSSSSATCRAGPTTPRCARSSTTRGRSSGSSSSKPPGDEAKSLRPLTDHLRKPA